MDSYILMSFCIPVDAQIYCERDGDELNVDL